MSPDRFEELMVKVVDGTASPAEKEELMAWIADKPELRQQLDTHRALKAVTDGWVARLEHDLVQDEWEARRGVRFERAFGLSLLLFGLLLLGGFGLVELVVDPEVPGVIKIGMVAGAVGTLALLVSVIRWRWATSQSDPYNEVIR